MDTSCNKRINFSKDEEQLLVALVEKYKSVIENKKSNVTTWKDKEKAWQVIEKEFNSNSGQNPRIGKQLKEKYLNMKKRAKQKFSNEKKCNGQTGGGPHVPVDITSVDIAIKDIIGKQITGLNNNYDCDTHTQMDSMDISCTNLEQDYVITIPHLEKDLEITTETNVEGTAKLDLEVMTDEVNIEDNNRNYKKWCDNSVKLLKKPITKQLKQTGSNTYKRKKMVNVENSEPSKRYISSNEQLIEKKLEFVQLQKETFLKEHVLQMENTGDNFKN